MKSKISDDFFPDINKKGKKKPDSYSSIILQNSSESRFAVSINGSPASSVGNGFNTTPFLPGMNAHTILTEINGDLFASAPVENSLFALRTGISEDNLFSYDGTIARNLFKFVSSDSYQLQTRVIEYNPFYKFYLQCGNNSISGDTVAYKWSVDGLENVSPSYTGQFRSSAFLRSTGLLYFSIVDGGNTSIVSYDGATWSNVASLSGQVFKITPFYDDDEYFLFAATENKIYKLDLNSNLITTDYTSAGVIQDISSTAWKIWLAELSGTNLTIKRRGSDLSFIHAGSVYASDFTISNCTQAIFGLEYGMILGSQSTSGELVPASRRPRGIYIACADTDTNIWANLYRRSGSNGKNWMGSNPNNLWKLESSIYTGGRIDSSNVGYPPVYYTSNMRIPKNSFSCFRKHMVILAPYSDGVDLWGRIYKNNYQSGIWMHVERFQGYSIEDIENCISPIVTARLHW